MFPLDQVAAKEMLAPFIQKASIINTKNKIIL